ncbi:hypothetical protein [Methylotenera sp. L2L1]|uniref:hypothetical protein n=1 Tax=Methylotenera sp. L2L1 TaxID=1502770 RepID=UPI00068D1ABF|nr:hypothetical protein [Methylotenera sp. L2L1]
MPQNSMLAHLLSKADISYVNLPLEALVCEQYHLASVPDYPIAAIAASEDGLDVGSAYWLRADPVYLVLQRDSFSLSEPCPLPVLRQHAEAIIASFNQHFEQDGLKFCLGNSGAWYVRLEQPPQVSTVLPAMAMGKNIAHYMPQGAAASVWVAYLNEVQMLLHGHAANAARELVGDVVINSIWLSGGGVMPAALTTKATAIDCIIGNSVFYQGLARHSGIVYQEVSLSVQDTISQFTKQSNVRLQLTQEMLLEEQTFQVLLNALNTKKISQLVINLACYEQTLVAKINPIDLYKFWRKSKPMSAYLV